MQERKPAKSLSAWLVCPALQHLREKEIEVQGFWETKSPTDAQVPGAAKVPSICPRKNSGRQQEKGPFRTFRTFAA